MRILTISDIDEAILHYDDLLGEIAEMWSDCSEELQEKLRDERKQAQTAIRALYVTRRLLAETETVGGNDSTPKTRGDAIRAMDDRQLAAYLYSVDGSGLKFCPDKVECTDKMDNLEDVPESDCMICLAEWLGLPPERSEARADV